MLNTVKILFYYSSKRKNKQGKAPIYYKLRVNGDELVRSTGIYILPEHWDAKAKKVIGGENGNEFADEFNSTLYEIQKNVLFKKLEADAGKTLLQAEVFFRPKPQPKNAIPTILEAAEEWNNAQGKEYGGHTKSTKDSYNKRAKKLREFLAARGLLKAKVTRATVQLCIEFKEWLLDKGYKPSYAKKIVHILKHAEKRGVIIGELQAQNMNLVVFKGHKQEKTVYLEPEELQEIFYQLKSPGLSTVAKYFILQSHTGYSYCDLMQINRSWLKVMEGINCLVDERQKTASVSIIPLFIAAEEILKEWNWTIPPITNQEYNRQLKLLATVCGINKKLTSHVARYTFGMIMLNNGYSLESVSKMLGHKSIKITERIYAKILPKRILAETKNLNMPVSYWPAA